MPPECNSYTVLHTPDRAATFRTGSTVLCDQFPTPAWYRFKGYAGYRMASNCVPTKRCGTAIPGWLFTSHPGVDEGVVTGLVCFHWKSDCCRFSTSIQLRNCGAYFVYRIQALPGCPMRYCGNGISKFNYLVSVTKLSLGDV